MQRPILLTLAVCLLAAGIIGFFLYGDPPAKPPREVELTVDSGKVLVTRGDDREIVKGGEAITADAGGLLPKSVASTPVPTAVSVAVAEPDASAATKELPVTTLELRLVDALGDPIRNGSVSVDGKVHEPQGGRFVVENLKSGAVEIVASATAYTSVEKTISIPAREPVDIPLEYVCDFVVEVHDKSEDGVPVAGVEVSLWEGPAAVRPVPSSVEIAVLDGSGHTTARPVLLRREEKGMRVRRAEGFGIVSGTLSEHGRANPKVGDLLLGLSGSLWRQGDRTQIRHYNDLMGRPFLPNSRLRLWDTFVALSQTDGKTVHQGTIEFESQGARYTSSLKGAGPATRGKLIATQLTDERGQCRFEGLPPGVYFANARKGEFRTYFTTLWPSHRWEKLSLRPVSETSVSVYVLKEGITHYQLKGINGADAHLKAADRVFILSGKANQFGEIRFRSVPWGRYKLTVSPPRHIDASPPTQVFEMTVEEPHTRVETLFDVDFGVTVSGRVLRADTKEPVEGFPLELEKENSYGSFGSTYSATGGTFSFSRVPSGKHIVFSGAVPGKHVVKACLNARNYKGFLPPSAVPTARGEKSEFPEPRFTVEDEDIEDIEYLVVPGVETHFVGQVVRADGQPVENAEIVLEGLDGAMLDSGLLSGADGRFDYSILLPEYDETIQAGLLGFEIGSNESTTKVIDGQKHITLPPSYSFGSRSINGHLLGRGSCPVEFKVGDTVRDIRLVLQLEKKELEGSTVSVRIAYEGGERPGEASVSQC